MANQFSNYPPPLKAPDGDYENPTPSNPTLHGTALSILSTVYILGTPHQKIRG
jgi:hypothetical protein